MFFGIAPDAEAEVGVAGLEQGDQIAGITQAIVAGHEFGLALRRITTEGHDIAVTTGVKLVRYLIQLRTGMPDAGEVGHDGEADLLPEQAADLGSAFAGAAAGPISHRDEIRGNALQGQGRLA